MIYFKNFFVCITAWKLGNISSTFVVVFIQNISPNHIWNV